MLFFIGPIPLRYKTYALLGRRRHPLGDRSDRFYVCVLDFNMFYVRVFICLFVCSLVGCLVGLFACLNDCLADCLVG